MITPTKLLLFFGLLYTSLPGVRAGEVITYPAPEGETLSQKFTVTVGGKNTPTYIARVASSDHSLRIKNVDDLAHSGEYYNEAAFTYFDIAGGTRVVVTCPQKIETARLLPTSAHVSPHVNGNTVTFDIAGPAKLTLEINGDWANSLHLFANPIETDKPKADDPNVIFYGPGIHEVDNVHVGSGKTVYIAGGAVVRGVPTPGKPKGTTFTLEGDHIVFRGRGIVDGSLSPLHSRHLVFVKGNDIRLEGVILRDSSVWTVPIRKSKDVTVTNLKLLGYRANSDGIDICNSTDVTVSDCFIRTFDDLVVVKTDKGQGIAGNILVEKCVLWNEIAHALSVGAELREDVDGVTFRDCDVIHDKGREWTLRVYHCDSAHIRNVHFENIRVEDAKRLISLWIGAANWSRDAERGHIDGIVFKNITCASGTAKIEFKGFDAEHAISNVLLENVVINGHPLARDNVITNAFVSNVVVTPSAPTSGLGQDAP
ncbi:MAG TPA: glycosyl hydrolase family 28 protein [Rariglobus sp.]|jgi:hypothetical protein|nr:glycosyl hydrolase family 28 protein [Rariglobus sp.]